MQSTATKLRIKFNKVRRAARWKKPNARFILIGRDLREPTPVPWEPMIEEKYADLADFMKRGWGRGHVYVFPMHGRQPTQLYRDLMSTLALNPFDSTCHGGSRKQMFAAHLESNQVNLQTFGRIGHIGDLTPEQLDSIHLTGNIADEVTKLQAAARVQAIEAAAMPEVDSVNTIVNVDGTKGVIVTTYKDQDEPDR